MTNRKSRVKIAEQTIQILESKAYQIDEGVTVDIAEFLDACVDKSVHYTPEMLQEILIEVGAKEAEEATFDTESTVIDVFNETTFAGAKTLLTETGEKTLSLNFASAKNPGGGFLSGSQAQEEALTRASGLFSSLTKYMDMYLNNRKFKSCLYQDHMIYSPDVPVFRNDDDLLIEEPWCTSIITAPAVNYGVLKDQEKSFAGQVMRQRIDMVLAIAYKNGYKNLVLGAWGCGVFKNNPKHIAGYFRDAFSENGKFYGRFERVRFSVLDLSNQGTYQTFKDVLS